MVSHIRRGSDCGALWLLFRPFPLRLVSAAGVCVVKAATHKSPYVMASLKFMMMSVRHGLRLFSLLCPPHTVTYTVSLRTQTGRKLYANIAG